ncbi:MAG: ABC transporter ATP-binding protein [Ignavibacteria bacterium]|nr:ABC transporter ATP-binding protein [Ignavibacteria bacterium]
MKAILLLLLPFLRARAVKLAFAFAAVLLVACTSLLYPVLLKWMIDAVSGPRAPVFERPVLLVAALAALFALSSVAGYYAHAATMEAGFLLRNELRARFFERLLARPLTFHRAQQTGELSARAIDDIGRLQPFFAGLLAPALQQMLVVAGCIALMALLHPLMTAAAIGLMLVPIPFLRFSGTRILGFYTDSTALHARASALFEETLVGIREVQSFSREETQASRYRALHRDALRGEMRAAKRQAGAQQGVSFLLGIVLLGVFFVSATRVVFPEWPVSGAVAFYLYAYTLAMASVALGRLYLTWQGLAGALRRTSALFLDASTTAPPASGVHRAPVLGAVAFRGVSFSYVPGIPVLEDFSLSVAAGEWLVVEGASGCGKSTIAALLPRLCDAQGGEILIDGIAIGAWDLAHLRGSIGLVAQEPVLFHGTLRENILFAPGDADPERLEQVLAASCVDQFLDALPGGLDTLVGERGTTLSGGQKSRIAIARALLLDPAILVLDEANAMLDADLEILLWTRLRAERAGKTTIVLGHHVSRIPPPYSHIALHPRARDGAENED